MFSTSNSKDCSFDAMETRKLLEVDLTVFVLSNKRWFFDLADKWPNLALTNFHTTARRLPYGAADAPAVQSQASLKPVSRPVGKSKEPTKESSTPVRQPSPVQARPSSPQPKDRSWMQILYNLPVDNYYDHVT